MANITAATEQSHGDKVAVQGMVTHFNVHRSCNGTIMHNSEHCNCTFWRRSWQLMGLVERHQEGEKCLTWLCRGQDSGTPLSNISAEKKMMRFPVTSVGAGEGPESVICFWVFLAGRCSISASLSLC